MKKLEDYDLKELIQNAKDAGACDDIHSFEKYSSVKEVLENVDSLTLYKSLAWYAENVIKGRWPEVEETILGSVYYSYLYAKNVIEGRWPEAERMISIHPSSAYYYAEYIIKGRWPEGEKVILKDAFYACYYAKNIVKGRWFDAEEVILDSIHRRDYLYSFPEAAK